MGTCKQRLRVASQDKSVVGGVFFTTDYTEYTDRKRKIREGWVPACSQ